jgi:hypothetical protein
MNAIWNMEREEPLQEVGWGGMDWIDMAQDRDKWRALLSAVMNLWIPQNAGNFLTSWRPVSFSRRTLLRTSVKGLKRKQWTTRDGYHSDRVWIRRFPYEIVLNLRLSICTMLATVACALQNGSEVALYGGRRKIQIQRHKPWNMSL